MKLCKCHGVPMANNGGGKLCCAIKKRITRAKAQKKYSQTPKGRAGQHRKNAKRILVGCRVVGRAKTAELAKQINDHNRRRLRERRKAV